MKEYFDKHGDKIEAGMFIKHQDEEMVEMVYATRSELSGEDLGINASNENYLRNNPDAPREYYSLINFDLSEWEIVTVIVTPA